MTTEHVVIPAVQRYVIAWEEAQRARRQLQRAQMTMRMECREVEATVTDPLVVELLDGSRFNVHVGQFGIVVSPFSSGVTFVPDENITQFSDQYGVGALSEEDSP